MLVDFRWQIVSDNRTKIRPLFSPRNRIRLRLVFPVAVPDLLLEQSSNVKGGCLSEFFGSPKHETLLNSILQ